MTTIDPNAVMDIHEFIFLEVDAERARQDAKWGEQNHAVVASVQTITKRDASDLLGEAIARANYRRGA